MNKPICTVISRHKREVVNMQDPLKIVMVVLLVVMEVPAAIFLIVAWKRACKERRDKEDG